MALYSGKYGRIGAAMKTYIYPIEVEQEEDGRWSAVVPSLPGCATWGQTQQEAVKALQEAIEAYITTLRESGQPIPQPRFS
jgi:predicted RNase H-like HicB family nuclease